MDCISGEKVKKIELAARKNFFLVYYALLTLAVILPLLKPGFILTLDLIWAPHRNYLAEHITQSFGGQAPFFAVLQFLEMFLPAWFVQKIILFSVFFVSGVSAHISAPSKSVYGKYFAGTLYAVNPFIYVRFLAGHLHILLAYAIVPLAVRSYSDFLKERWNPGKWKKVLLWTTLISIFDFHVLLTVILIQLCIFLFALLEARNERNSDERKSDERKSDERKSDERKSDERNNHEEKSTLRDVIRNNIMLGLFYTALNMFWILPVFISLFQGTSVLSQISDPDLAAFTARRTVEGNVLVSLAMMYGFWRKGYLYPFHIAPEWIFLLLFTVILFLMVHGYMSSEKKPLHRGLALSAGISLVLAAGITYPYFAPVFEFLFDHFFIFRGMRDSQKFVGVLALAYSFLGSIGVEKLVESIRWQGRARKTSREKQKLYSGILAVFLLATPLSYSFSIFNGFSGQVEPLDYPEEWYEANEFLKNDTEDFDTLFFPWHLYMTFEWSGRRIANPADAFFEKPVLIGENAEVGSIDTQSSNPTQHYVGYLLEQKNETGNFGELIAPLNVKYIILAKEVDYRKYDFLYEQEDLEIAMENEKLVVFRNLHETSRIREVSELKEIGEWSDLVELSKTADINDFGIVLKQSESGSVETSFSSTAFSKDLNYTQLFPLKYRLEEAPAKYVIFTPPDHDQKGWELEKSKKLESAGLTSVFEVSGQYANTGTVYYKPLTDHLIGAALSLLAISVILSRKQV